MPEHESAIDVMIDGSQEPSSGLQQVMICPNPFFPNRVRATLDPPTTGPLGPFPVRLCFDNTKDLSVYLTLRMTRETAEAACIALSRLLFPLEDNA